MNFHTALSISGSGQNLCWISGQNLVSGFRVKIKIEDGGGRHFEGINTFPSEGSILYEINNFTW